MFRIRKIHDITIPNDQEAVKQIQHILKEQFPLLVQKDIDDLPDKLVNPLKYQLRTVLLIADDGGHKVKGFAIMNHAPDMKFSYLDFISVAPKITSSGIGSALYQKVQEEAIALNSLGIFMECLPDDSNLCKDKTILKQNASRLRFYERFNVFPIIGTKYETPIKKDGDCPPYLVFDSLKNSTLPTKQQIKKIVKAILNRKYSDSCSESYVKMVVNSFRDDHIILRSPRYPNSKSSLRTIDIIDPNRRIALIVNDKHDIHHIRQRGYVEAPVRLKSILDGIKNLTFFDRFPKKHFSEKFIKEVHAHDYYEYFKRICSNLKEKESVYPYVFPVRNQSNPPKELAVRAGYYCIDTFTPINKNAYIAAKAAVDCALTAAEKILNGYRLSYALVRPTGHHAEKRYFGGFCYFNSAAIAAHYLTQFGTVAVLDIDYHHGNGTQDIFYDRSDVLTVSIHGEPSVAYPYFSGFKEEQGNGEGVGCNVNFPLPETYSVEQYQNTLKKALVKISDFNPKFLVLALGFDTAKNDPTGTWELLPKHFEENAKLIKGLNIPILIVQEGGYRSKSLGSYAKRFFSSLHYK